jgi:hypothetical protein
VTTAFGYAAIGYAAVACVVAGVLCGALALIVGGGIRTALRIALDLWLAAGLLRLALPSDSADLLAASAILVVRQIVGLGLRPRPGGAAACAALTGRAGTPWRERSWSRRGVR